MKQISRSIHQLAAYGLVGLGAIHAGLALCFGQLSTDAVWFAGAGLALVFLGLLNLSAGLADVRSVWTICRAANVAGLAFAAPAAIAVWEPQGYLGLVLVATLALTSWMAPTAQDGRASRAVAIAGAAVLGTCAIAVGYMLVGCVRDGHPLFQIVTWALLLPAFAWAAWWTLRGSKAANRDAG